MITISILGRGGVGIMDWVAGVMVVCGGQAVGRRDFFCGIVRAASVWVGHRPTGRGVFEVVVKELSDATESEQQHHKQHKLEAESTHVEGSDCK